MRYRQPIVWAYFVLMTAGMASLATPAACQRAPVEAGGQQSAQDPVTHRLMDEGDAAYVQRKLEDADRLYRQGKDAALAQRNRDRALDFIAKAMTTAHALGLYEQARDDASEGLALAQQEGKEDVLATWYDYMATAQSYLGEYREQLKFAFEALKHAQDLVRIAGAYYNISQGYANLGQYREALDNNQRAIDSYMAASREQDVTNCLISRGLIFVHLGRYNEAEDLLLKFQPLAGLKGRRDVVAAADLFLGLTEWYQDRFTDARNHFLSAANYFARPPKGAVTDDLAGVLPDIPYLAFSYGGVALTLAGEKRYNEANQYMGMAEAANPTRTNPRDKMLDAGIRGLICEGQGQLSQAIESYKTMLTNLELLGEEFGDASQISAIMEGLPHPYGRLASVYLQEQNPIQALLTVESGRAQGLVKQLAQNHLTLASLIESHSVQDAQLLRDLTRKQQQTNRRVIDAQEHPHPPTSSPQYAAWVQEMRKIRAASDEAERQYTLLRNRLILEYPEYGQMQGKRQVTWSELQRLTQRNPQTLFLEYSFLDKTRLGLFALSAKDGLFTALLEGKEVGETELSRLTTHWRNEMITDDEDGEPDTAHSLFKLLFGELHKKGILARGRYQRLVIVGDGPLLDLPFVALIDDDGARLVQRYAVSYSVSLGLLLRKPLPNKLQNHPENCFLGVADPLGTGSPKNNPLALRDADDGSLEPLPGARDELAAIIRGLPTKQGVLSLVGHDATEGRVKRKIGHYALLHFATHGLLNVSNENDHLKNGLLSGLLLAPEPADSKEDGILEAREIVELHLTAYLAVLSACNTARGVRTGGDGIVGLAWAFRAAGCPCIVASQWNIPDTATAPLMVRFYKYLADGKPKDIAMQRAMQDLQVQEKESRPAWWAAFQVIGDTDPLPPELLRHPGHQPTAR